MKPLRSHLTYANMMSTIAVFGVLAGGGAYAASQIGPNDIGKNAVRAKHIKHNQVRAKHVARNAVRPKHLRAGSVATAKLADGAVTAQKLAPGAVTSSTVGSVVVRSQPGTIGAGAFATVTSTCHSGEIALGGGGQVPIASEQSVRVNTSYPDIESFPGGTQFHHWRVRFRNGGGSPAGVTAHAVCLQP